MSFDAINWATKQRVGNATAKHALLWLAFHANGKSGECFPSIETLMDEMEVGSRNTVKAALRLLIDRDLITCVRETAGSRVTRTLYTLNVDRSKTDPSNIDGSNSDASDIDADGSNFDSLMGQKLTPNKEIEQGINKEVMCAPSGAPQPPEMSDDEIADLLDSVPQGKGSPISSAPKRSTPTPRKKPATRCPFDAEALIPDDYRQIAEKAGIGDPQQVFSAFVNHAIAHDRSLVVWPAGFRTWCSNELRYHPNQTPKPKPLHQRTAADYDW